MYVAKVNIGARKPHVEPGGRGTLEGSLLLTFSDRGPIHDSADRSYLRPKEEVKSLPRLSRGTKAYEN